MNRRLVDLALRNGLALACLCACGDHEVEVTDQLTPAEHRSAEAVSAVPRTIDRGDGCLVEVLLDGPGRELVAGDEVILAYDARVCGAEAPFASTRDWVEACRVKLGPTGDPPLIAGLVRGLTGLTVGTKARIEVPPALAYGREGLPAAGIPADASLVFEVEILGVH